MVKLIEQLKAYEPFNEQEAADKEVILSMLKEQPDIFHRSSLAAHMTASGWVVNPQRTKVLMAYHNLYGSWAWLGGHADGEEDLLKAAVKEVREESGAVHVKPVTEEIFSVEIIPVSGHVKKGKYVSSHLHLNVTYLLEVPEEDMLRMKEDENSAVGWFGLEEAIEASKEQWFRERIYGKLNLKLRNMAASGGNTIES